MMYVIKPPLPNFGSPFPIDAFHGRITTPLKRGSFGHMRPQVTRPEKRSNVRKITKRRRFPR